MGLLFQLIDAFLGDEAADLANEGIRLRVVGDRAALPKRTRQLVEEAERTTRFGRAMTLCLALGPAASLAGTPGSRGEITAARRAIAEKVEAGELDAAAIDADVVGRHLMTRDLPDPDLLIRTAREVRLSNFLLWQMAYAETLFLETLWPDFGRKDLEMALAEFGNRHRSYGQIAAAP